ncbi:MAG: O-antigen ligase family protein [Microthrixaceae bacterium]
MHSGQALPTTLHPGVAGLPVTTAPALRAPTPGNTDASRFTGSLLPSRNRVRVPRFIVLLACIVGEVALALAMKSVPTIGLIQAGAIVAVGCYSGLRGDISKVLCVIGYVTGTEVLWRQVRPPLPYQAAPYLAVGFALITVLFRIRRINGLGRRALLYLGLLVPSIVITIQTGGSDARELVAFALSGPAALVAILLLTSQVRSNMMAYRRLLWVTLISTVGPLTVGIQDIRSVLSAHEAIRFTKQSNFVTSGGFGPVQVSSVLGMGILCGVLLIIAERDRLVRLLAVPLTLALTVQTLLTFSRGGSFATAIALSILFITQTTDRRIRNRMIVIATVTLVVAQTILFPWLNDFTSGKFQERFSDTRSGRTELAANDLTIFRRNFLFGVGPGMTKYQRLTYEVCQLRADRCANEASSHTEFTRMVSEHGLPGIGAIVVMATMVVGLLKRPRRGRPLALAWMGWAIAQMFYANLRVVAIPFAFAIAFITVTDWGTQRHPDSSEDDELPHDPSGRQRVSVDVGDVHRAEGLDPRLAGV